MKFKDWYSINQVCEILNMTPAQVKYLKGFTTQKMDKRTVWYYRGDVGKFAKDDSWEIRQRWVDSEYRQQVDNYDTDDYVKMSDIKEIMPHTRQAFNLIVKQGRIGKIKVHNSLYYAKDDVKRWLLTTIFLVQENEMWKKTNYKSYDEWLNALNKW